MFEYTVEAVLSKTASTVKRCSYEEIRSSSWNRAWDIASCFFSAGSMIAGLLDFLDGRFDGKCRIW